MIARNRFSAVQRSFWPHQATPEQDWCGPRADRGESVA